MRVPARSSRLSVTTTVLLLSSGLLLLALAQAQEVSCRVCVQRNACHIECTVRLLAGAAAAQGIGRAALTERGRDPRRSALVAVEAARQAPRSPPKLTPPSTVSTNQPHLLGCNVLGRRHRRLCRARERREL